MCGIVGLLSSGGISDSVRASLGDHLNSRGPDGYFDVKVDGFWGAMSRLAINGIPDGRQPFVSASGRYNVFYNGEIYNHKQLERTFLPGVDFSGKSDGSALPELLEMFGPQAFSMLDGMYAIAAYDSVKHTLYLARDPEGEKPLYYTSGSNRNGFAFGSTIQSIILLKGVRPRFRPQAISDLLSFLWIPEPATFYEDILAVEPGATLSIQCGGGIRRLRTSVSGGPRYDPSHQKDLVERVRSLVEASVKKRLMSEVPVGTFLSGGVDSSIVTSIAAEATTNLRSYTVGFVDSRAQRISMGDETRQAEQLAKKLALSHRIVDIGPDWVSKNFDKYIASIDQPFSVSSALGILAVSEAAQNDGVKVLLSGDCADEIFGGYSWYEYLSAASLQANHDLTICAETSWYNDNLTSRERAELISRLSPQDQAFAWHYFAMENEKNNLLSGDIFANASSSMEYFKDFYDGTSKDKILGHDRAFYMRNEMLTKLDRMTMAYSVEGRAAFCDRDLINYVKGIPANVLIPKGNLKYVLKEAFASILGKEMMRRPKQGFVFPLKDWFQDGLVEHVAEITSSGSALKRNGIVSKDFNEHLTMHRLKSNFRNAHIIFTLIVLNRWMENNGY